MSSAGWSSVSFDGSASGQTITFTLSGLAYEYTYASGITKSWTFYLYKNGSSTGQVITGWSYEQMAARFNNVSFTYTSSDFGTSVTYSVVGICHVTAGGEEFDAYTEDNPSKAINIGTPSVTWDSDAEITAVPTSDFKVTVTRSGVAKVRNGFSGTVYYRLECGSRVVESSTQNAVIADNSPPYDIQITYKLYGFASIGGNTYTTATPLQATTIVVTGNYIDYFDGTNWVQCKAYYYDGSSWVECKPYYYDGTSWVECSS